MKTLARLFTGLLVSAFMLAGVVASPAIAQDKAMAAKGKTVIKVLLENDKVRVFEAHAKPGDENLSPPYPEFRVLIPLKGGSALRTYADGKTEKVEYKTGEVMFIEPSKTAFTVKNIGKTEYVLYVVVLKQPKK